MSPRDITLSIDPALAHTLLTSVRCFIHSLPAFSCANMSLNYSQQAVNAANKSCMHRFPLLRFLPPSHPREHQADQRSLDICIFNLQLLLVHVFSLGALHFTLNDKKRNTGKNKFYLFQKIKNKSKFIISLLYSLDFIDSVHNL